MFWHTLLTLILFIAVPFATAASLEQGRKPTELLIYDNGLTLVHEYKSLRLEQNDTKIEYKGVSQNAIADSIYVELPKKTQLISQHFSTAKKGGLYEATEQNGNLVFSLHHNTKQETQLTLKIAPKEALQTQLRLEYLMQGIALELRYRVFFDGATAIIEGFASIDNQSEQSFTDATLTLLLGEVQRVHTPSPLMMQSRNFESADANGAPTDGYRLHTIAQRVSLPSKTQTQLLFLPKTKLKAKKHFHVTLSNPLYLHGEQRSPITQSLLINTLPTSLPKGVVRSFADENGKILLLGESPIKQTPKGDSLELTLGVANDLSVTQTLLREENKDNKRSRAIRYVVQNMSQTAKVMELHIPFVNSKSAKITTKEPYRFTKGNLVTFSPLVASETKTSFDVIFESEK